MGESENRSALAVTTWSLEAVGGSPGAEGVRSTIAFGTDGRVSGRGGVNQFGGSYQVVGETIEFGQMMATLMAGPPEAMQQERAFLDSLSGVQPYSIDGDVLTIGEARLRRVAPVVVSGHVTYRQRIALPPGAVVIVQVVDVSRADAPSTTVAEQRVDVEHQVPIPFSLALDPGSLDPRRSYAVTVRIEVDGELMWTSDTHHPVATDGPTEVEIPLLMARS
jgi:uncharacterized lipoprotein YbaY